MASLVDLASGTGKEVSDLIGGFRVTITSYLYRLEWTEAVASEFYEKYYYDSLSVDVHKKKRSMPVRIYLSLNLSVNNV